MLAREPEPPDGDIRDVAAVAPGRNVQWGLATKIQMPTPETDTEISAEGKFDTQHSISKP